MYFLTRPSFLLLLLFSAFPLAFFLWLLSIFVMVKDRSEELYPAVHMIVVLKHSTDLKTINAVLDKITMVSGEKSVRILSGKDILAYMPPMKDGEKMELPSRFQRILSVRISYGKNTKGEMTYLVPQIQSIQGMLNQDSHVLLMEVNEKWASNLDYFKHLLEKTRVVGLSFFIFSSFALLFFWTLAIRSHWGVNSNRVKGEKESHDRKRMWDSTASLPVEEQSEAPPFHIFLGGLFVGLFSGLIALLSVMALHPILYPDGLDPFMRSAQGGISGKDDWICVAFPLLTGAMGWFSSVLSRI